MKYRRGSTTAIARSPRCRNAGTGASRCSRLPSFSIATIRRFNGFLRKRVGFGPKSDTDPHDPSAWPSAKRSHVGSSAVVRSVQWPHRSDAPLPLSAVS